MRGEETGRKEGWDRVGEEHLGDDAVVFELLLSTRRIPIAVRLGAAQVVERVLVVLRPFVELVVPLRLEVFAVVEHARPGVTVRRDDDVAAVRELRHGAPSSLRARGSLHT